MTTQKLAVLQTKYDGLRETYAKSTGSMFDHYNLVARMGAIRREIQAMTAVQTVLDWDGTFEGRLIAAGAKFTVRDVPVPTTDRRELALWVAEITVGEVQ